jgi:hypothetical protein
MDIAPHSPPVPLRPGERLVAGRAYIYDHDALADWLAVEAKRDAPDDLAALATEDLNSLFRKALRLAALSGHRDMELLVRVEAERARRRTHALERAA